jgi:hypothetical protein
VTRRWWWPALVALAALATGACGVPTDDRPRPIAAGDVPFRLLDRPTATTTTSTPGSLGAVVDIYLVSGDRVFPVPRALPAPLTVHGAIGALLDGPTRNEAAFGLRSALGAQVTLLSTLVAQHTVRLDLGASFETIQGQEQVLAVAQLVYTITAVPGITAVTFTLDGRPVEVPTGDGTLRAGALTRDDFAGVGPA